MKKYLRLVEKLRSVIRPTIAGAGNTGKWMSTPAKKHKEMEKGNTQLKKLVADLSLDISILKELLGKNNLARQETYGSGSMMFCGPPKTTLFSTCLEL